uniref:Stereocilin LRR domain-containing protein n=1 Tax=Callorhinchus milii TaxID=7868 RepID=A0A4W3HQF2_CALMI
LSTFRHLDNLGSISNAIFIILDIIYIPRISNVFFSSPLCPFVFQVSQMDEPALETLTASFLHKFPKVTPDLFVDLSQFIPFMTSSDIMSFPVSLLLNNSVPHHRMLQHRHSLAAIRDHSSEMKPTQKKAFAKRLLNVNTFGDVSSWPPYFLSSVQPLLSYLPLCHFQQLTAQQVRNICDKDCERFIRSCTSSAGSDFRRAKPQSCDWPCSSPTPPTLPCTDVNLIINVSALNNWNLLSLGPLLPVLGVRFLKDLPEGPRSRLVSSLGSVEFPPAQVSPVLSTVLLLICQQGVASVGEVSGEVLDNMGPILTYVDEETIKQINQPEFLLRLDDIKRYCIPEENRNSFGRMLIETNDVLTLETVEMVLRSQGEWDRSDIGSLCQSQQSSQARTVLLSKKQSLASKAVKKPVPKCVDIKVTFPAAWSSGQLAAMDENEFTDCLEIVTWDKDLSVEHLKVVLSRAKQVYGPVKTMEPWHILALGRAVTQLSDKDLQDLDLSDLGILSFLGEMEEWNTKQTLENTCPDVCDDICSHVCRHNAGTRDMHTPHLNPVCKKNLTLLNGRDLIPSEAVLFVGKLRLRCSEAQLQALATLTAQPQAFGLISEWGPEIFTEIGSISAGLPDIVLSSLVKPQIEGLSATAISLMGPNKFAVVFSPGQLSCFTSDQAAAVTLEQYDQLDTEQRQAINAAQYEGDGTQESRGLSLLLQT